MNRKHILVLILFIASSFIGIIAIFPAKVRADGPVSYIPTSYQGRKGSYSGGSLENLEEKDSLYFDWDVESEAFPPFFTIYSFEVDFFFDVNVGPVYEIDIELSFHQSVSIKVYYDDGSTEFDTTFLGSLIIKPNGKEVVKIRASCTYYYNYYPTCSFNQIVLNPITIQSPSDGASFSGPMEGYYPATYGFEEDEEWASCLNIGFIDDIGSFGLCQIYNSWSDNLGNVHNKVLYVEDMGTGTDMKFVHDFDPLPSIEGNVEFWFLMTDKYQGASDRVLLYTSDDQDKCGFGLTMGDGKFIDTFENEAPMTYDMWYHVRIHFYGPYSYYYDWYLNDKLQYSNVPWENGFDSTTNLVIQGDVDTRGQACFDAFSFSWDPYHKFRENHLEGFLLNIKHQELDEIYYTLDEDDANKVVISGDTVIPMPFMEHHTIKVGGSLNGQDFETSSIDFSYIFGEKYAMVLWCSEMDGPWAQNDEYVDILQDKGFTIYWKKMDPKNYQIQDKFADLCGIMDSDDLFFLYIHGHGANSLGESKIKLSVAEPNGIPCGTFELMMENLPCQNKMIIADSCHSEGFVFDKPGHVAISACRINENSKHYGPIYPELLGEGYLGNSFFNYLEEGYNALYSFYKTKDILFHAYNFEPLISYRSDANFFSY